MAAASLDCSCCCHCSCGRDNLMILEIKIVSRGGCKIGEALGWLQRPFFSVREVVHMTTNVATSEAEIQSVSMPATPVRML